MTAPVILWFRNDLRLADHAALHTAVASGQPVLPVYILDDTSPGRWALGGAARWWLHHSLSSLSRDLASRGAGLLLRRGPAREVMRSLVRETGADAVIAAASHEPWLRETDAALTRELARDRVRFSGIRMITLYDPDLVTTRSGGPFGVYSAFVRRCLERGPPQMPLPAPQRIPCRSLPASDRLDDWRLLPSQPDWAGGLRASWSPGEAGAQVRLQHFVQDALPGYAEDRDFPARSGTSMLSPHLRFGELSAAQVWHALPEAEGLAAFRRELLWREFCYYLLWHHPALPDQPLQPAFGHMPWRDDPGALRAWQRGQTGIPIVDAGMRQLWQTGWMHNRVRMIVASFLVKHLLLPWQHGEAWFWGTLVDADLANNAGNWQWVAGCGADAAPYFRIFNPVLQGRKFDPDGAYVRRFVPELSRLDAPSIHAPWEAPAIILAGAGIRIGHDYPAPLIDLTAGRRRALDALAAMKSSRPRANP